MVNSVIYPSLEDALKDESLGVEKLFCVSDSDNFAYFRKDSNTEATPIPDLFKHLFGTIPQQDNSDGTKTDFYLVPFQPTEDQWDGLARAVVMWLDMHPKTPRALFKHLERSGYDIPQWLRDEPEMKNLDHVPSKGTRAAIIYKAMLTGYAKTT